MQLNNKTPFAVETVIFPNPDGVDALYTTVKASFAIGAQWTLADEQPTPQDADEYWGEPGQTSLKYTTDYHTGKPATDIVVLGDAIVPGGHEVDQLDVGVSVGDVQKVLRIYGDRAWNNGFATKPELFQRMPIVYENAFGGSSIIDGELKSLEQRNPVGKGFKGKTSRENMQGQALPNIEDPKHLIQDMSDTPFPAGFGFCAPHWAPRSGYGGTYDEQWQIECAPYLPFDYSEKFQNAASPDLIYPGFLVGGEKVKIVNMHESGVLDFHLPTIKIGGQLKTANSPKEEMVFNMESVIIKPNKLQLQMVWKSIYVGGNKVSKIRTVDVSLSRVI